VHKNEVVRISYLNKREFEILQALGESVQAQFLLQKHETQSEGFGTKLNISRWQLVCWPFHFPNAYSISENDFKT